MTQPDVLQEEITTVYDHIFGSLQQGQQPGTFKQIAASTGVNFRRIGSVVSSLCATGNLQAWKADATSKYSPLQYDIPGYEFPQEPVTPVDPYAEDRRLIHEAITKIKWLASEGYSPAEITVLVPDHVDGSKWSEASIANIITGKQPNYAGIFKTF